ncbi:MAG: hypothetical protein AAF605_04065 [Myxococcota bacterium]
MTLTLNDALEFDIDVDVSALIGAGLNDVLVDSRYYVRAKQPQTRLAAHELRVLDDDLDVQIRWAQWRAAAALRSDRRRTRRAPLLRRLIVDGHRSDGYVCDISREGLRASGRPRSGVIDLELKLPSLPFPLETRAEVIDFRDANVLPIMNLRFINLRRHYADGIEAYVQRRLAS